MRNVIKAFVLAVTVSGMSFFSAGMPAWSLDLSVRNTTSHLTPISQIQNNQIPENATVPATHNGTMGVDAIKSLEYRPQETAAQVTPMSAIQQVENTLKVQPAFVVFPVILHKTQNKAFSDLPVLLSTSVASQLTEKLAKDGLQCTVINPLYAYDTLKEKGLDGLYEKIIRDYMEAGQPNESDLLYLADHLSTKTRPITWIVFVQAEFNMNQTTKPVGLGIPMAFLVDQVPKDVHYFLNGAVQIYNTQEGIPLFWDRSTTASLKLNGFGNFTKSVFDDSDSTMRFRRATAQMARQLIANLPSQTIASHAQIQAKLVSSTQNILPGFSPEDQAALKRLQQY